MDVKGCGLDTINTLTLSLQNVILHPAPSAGRGGSKRSNYNVKNSVTSQHWHPAVTLVCKLLYETGKERGKRGPRKSGRMQQRSQTLVVRPVDISCSIKNERRGDKERVAASDRAHLGVKGSGHLCADVLPLALPRGRLPSSLAQDEGRQDAQVIQVLQDGPSRTHHARMRQHRTPLHVFLHHIVSGSAFALRCSRAAVILPYRVAGSAFQLLCSQHKSMYRPIWNLDSCLVINFCSAAI